MKKVTLIAAFSFFLAAGAMAQTTGGSSNQQPTAKQVEKRQDEKAVKSDVNQVKADKAQRAADVKAGNKAGAKAENKDIKNDKQTVKTDAKTAKSAGVKHPVRKAVHHK